MYITIGLGIVCLIISYRQLKEKGFVFNNGYLYKSKEDRAKMTIEEKRPLYRQSAVVFVLAGIICILLGIDTAFSVEGLSYIYYGLTGVMLVYVIVSSIKMGLK